MIEKEIKNNLPTSKVAIINILWQISYNYKNLNLFY